VPDQEQGQEQEQEQDTTGFSRWSFNFSLQTTTRAPGHQQALAGGGSTSELVLSAGRIRFCSFEIEVPPAEAGGVCWSEPCFL